MPYDQIMQESIEEAVRKFERGELRCGRSGQKVMSRRQAIAIGFSEARKRGAKIPPPPR
jgi:hypothetical protein